MIDILALSVSFNVCKFSWCPKYCNAAADLVAYGSLGFAGFVDFSP